MSDLPKYVNKNSEFTAVKIEGSEEERRKAIYNLLDKAEWYIKLSDLQKIMIGFEIETSIEEGIISKALLLALVLPPASKTKFKDIPPGTRITFDLPPKSSIQSPSDNPPEPSDA